MFWGSTVKVICGLYSLTVNLLSCKIPYGLCVSTAAFCSFELWRKRLKSNKLENGYSSQIDMLIVEHKIYITLQSRKTHYN